MKIPDNIYMNICKVFQEIYKNKFELNELNIAEVGSRGKNMTCRYRITVPEEMESVTFSYYDAVVYDAGLHPVQSKLFQIHPDRFTPGNVRRRESTVLLYKRQDTKKRAEASRFPGKASEYHHRHRLQ